MQNVAQTEQMRNTWSLQPKDAMVLAMSENPTYRRSAAVMAAQPSRKRVARRAIVAAAVGALVPYGFGAAEYGVLMGGDMHKIGIIAGLMGFGALFCGLMAMSSGTTEPHRSDFDDTRIDPFGVDEKEHRDRVMEWGIYQDMHPKPNDNYN